MTARSRSCLVHVRAMSVWCGEVVLREGSVCVGWGGTLLSPCSSSAVKSTHHISRRLIAYLREGGSEDGKKREGGSEY